MVKFRALRLGWFVFVPGQHECDPFCRFMLLTNCENRNHDGEPDKGAHDAPEKALEKHRKQNDERRHRQRSTCNPRLKITSDKELDKVQIRKDDKASLPQSRLDQHKQRWKNGGNQRTEKKRDIIQNEGGALARR